MSSTIAVALIGVAFAALGYVFVYAASRRTGVAAFAGNLTGGVALVFAFILLLGATAELLMGHAVFGTHLSYLVPSQWMHHLPHPAIPPHAR